MKKTAMVFLLWIMMILGSFALASWWTSRVRPEPAAEAIIQRDSSVVLARSGAAPDSAPPHLLPKGSKEVRRVHVVAQPSRGVVVHPAGTDEAARLAASSDRTAAVDSCDCPAVEVDLSLVRMPDKTGRVIASSPSGNILSGIDFPLEPLGGMPAGRPWAAGISFDSDLRLGVFVERDLGPFRIGLDASANSRSGVNSKAWAGIRF